VRALGIDIGSRTVKLVIVDADGSIVDRVVRDTTPDVASECEALIAARPHDRILSTGYGRALAEVRFNAPSVTEIKAHARGARAALPEARTVLDLGGQDMKVIAMDGSGRVTRFEMNDRCAAGAGRFLEMMAGVLRLDMDGFARAALEGQDTLTLNSMCAVFAESEVVGLLTAGRRREDIARAVHQAIARRAASMIHRLGGEPPVVFTGGGALNPCLARLVEEAAKCPVLVPEEPRFAGAHGAALLALERAGP
jgi:predicted CoA-substrate-specific enzyme activase